MRWDTWTDERCGQLKKHVFQGVATALVTPFSQDGSIHYDNFKKLIDFQINAGVDALVVCGTTGEASTLSYTEHQELVSFCCAYVNGRVPVIAGSGSNDTAHAVEQSFSCQKNGADALLVVTPYYNKTSQSGLLRHYYTIAESVDLPIIVYNVPSRTGVNILPETYRKLAECENICAIKEASGNISAVAQTAQLCGDVLDLYSGNDDQIVPILSLGGKGVISVLSNFRPDIVKNICSLYFAQNTHAAAQLQLHALPLIRALFSDVNPMPVKYAMNLLGFDVGPCRLPLTEPDEACKNAIEKNLQF